MYMAYRVNEKVYLGLAKNSEWKGYSRLRSRKLPNRHLIRCQSLPSLLVSGYSTLIGRRIFIVSVSFLLIFLRV